MASWSTASKVTASAALCVALSAPLAAQQVFTAQGLRAEAAQAAIDGRQDVALALADALLQRNPDDVEALLVRSRVFRDRGAFARAAEAGRKAYAASTTPEMRYASATSTAFALRGDGRRLAAQRWLRLAAQAAPNAAAKAEAVRSFRIVRQETPLRLSFSFNIAPTSNVNNGSTNQEVRAGDLNNPFVESLIGSEGLLSLGTTARALSGTEISGGVVASYRLRATQSVRTEVTGQVYHRTYRLSDEARDIAPDAQGRDFALTYLSVGLSQSHVLADQRSLIGWSVTGARTNYGGAPLNNSLTLRGWGRTLLGERASLGSSLSLEHQAGFGTREDAHLVSADVDWTYALDGGQRLSLALGATQSASDADFLDYTETRARAGYSFDTGLWNTGLEFGASVSRREYPGLTGVDGTREDVTGSLSVTAVLRDVEYLGFVPTITLRTRRTESTNDVYDSEGTGLQFGIRSAF